MLCDCIQIKGFFFIEEFIFHIVNLSIFRIV